VDISAVDRFATTGSSPLHRASAVAKLIAFACVLVAVIANANVLVIAGLALALAAVVVAFRLPAGTIAALAGYPAFFAAIFALASAPDVLTGALFVAKALTAALAAIILMFTTPYPQVFAPLQRVVPGVVGDAMLMTYRSFFLLAEKFGHLFTAIRLRSGFSRRQPLLAARGTTQALGALLLYSFDLAQRDYDVMRLRGYEGRLRAHFPPRVSVALDAAVVATGAALLAVALAWRVAFLALNPLSWLVPLLGLLSLAAAAIYRWRS
jgi:energy-coupling factor transporter transmembrane protein EcfT